MADRLWRCPRCHTERRQPDFVTGVGHTCQPPGRPVKWVDWVAVDRHTHRWHWLDGPGYFVCVDCREIDEA